MNTATQRLGLWVAAFCVLALPAWAQTAVTFQVDLSTAIERCAFDPADEGVIIGVPGSFNEWNTTASRLTDTDGDGIYTGTFEIAPGQIDYKFWGTGSIGWEDGDNRTATIGSEPVTLPVATFNKTFADACGGPNYLLLFEVDMSIQESLGRFDPDDDALYVQGSFQGWNNLSEDWRLSQNPFAPDFFTREFQVALEPGTTYAYKFAFRPEDGGDTTWESGPDRTFTVTGDEPIDEETGLRLLEVRRYFDDITPADVLADPATVRFEVDLRPAFYFLMDNGFLPADTQTGEPVENIQGLFVNGPVASASIEDAATDWATWGPDGLGLITTRQLFDTGANGDVVAGDSVYTRIYTYPAGTPRVLVGKFGINGYDNEGGFGADHNFRISPGEQTIRMKFGCVLNRDGTFSNNRGPQVGEQDFSLAYTPYLVVDNEADPPTCSVIRGAVSVEDGIGRSDVVSLGRNFPNPFTQATTLEYVLPAPSHVSLAVYDLMGRRVAMLVDEVQAANTYTVRFDAGDLASGTYVYRLVAGDQVLTQRMTVVR